MAGIMYIGLYGYNGNGNRVWKLTGTCDAEWQNGGVIVYRAILDDAVLYPNPYITITPQGYTKHYYIGQERIASATGGGRWEVTPDHLNNREADIIDDYWGHYTSNNPFEEVSGGKTDNENLAGNTPSVLQYDCAPTQLFRLGLKWEDDMLSSCINTYLQYSGAETTYFTHNDHLGSASWITDGTGVPVQYIHYAPYGELLADQKPTGSTYDERYKFTGKERDAETGYDYFGARNYFVDAGIWTRVDPLVDKYLYVSPYMYCEGNPIVLRDPDGMASANYINCTQYENEAFKGWQIKFDDNRLHIWFHGTQEGIYELYVNNQLIMTYNINEENALDNFEQLFSNDPSINDTWFDITSTSSDNRGPKQVVFHGCYTAKLAEAFAKKYPGIYFTGADLKNHTEVRYFGEQATNVEIGVYDYGSKIGEFLNIGKKEGEWQTYYVDPNSNTLQCIPNQTNVAPLMKED